MAKERDLHREAEMCLDQVLENLPLALDWIAKIITIHPDEHLTKEQMQEAGKCARWAADKGIEVLGLIKKQEGDKKDYVAERMIMQLMDDNRLVIVPKKEPQAITQGQVVNSTAKAIEAS
jgi:hypothetical protein